MMQPDQGRRSEGRTLGGGYSANIPRREFFQRFRYQEARLSDGVATEKPYYCYDAQVMVIKGLCEVEPIAQALAKEGLFPLCAPNGRVPTSLWFNDIHDSVIGPYREVVVAIDCWARPHRLASGRALDPYGLLYNFFGSPCLTHLHTLYIDSPLSIRWGREMQAFPKHPRPATIDLAFGSHHFNVAVGWPDLPLIRAAVGRRWGVQAFAQQAVALVKNFGLWQMLSYLASPILKLDIAMPLALKREHSIECSHQGHVLKGYDPLAIRTWPWSSKDWLELSTGRQAQAADGQESATDLLSQADFQPGLVLHIPSLQLLVSDAEQKT